MTTKWNGSFRSGGPPESQTTFILPATGFHFKRTPFEQSGRSDAGREGRTSTLKILVKSVRNKNNTDVVRLVCMRENICAATCNSRQMRVVSDGHLGRCGVMHFAVVHVIFSRSMLHVLFHFYD